jgi:cell division protein FtsL
LQFQVFLICLTATIAIVILYSLTSKKTYRLNQGLNNELETQVSVLEQEKSEPVRTHFRRLKRWNIHLSDLETWNF